MIAHTIKSLMNIKKIQVFIGLAALFFGVAVYIIRSPGRVYFVPKYFSYLRLPDDIVNVVRIVGGNLPDFIHPFAFILITAGLISLDNRKTQFFICLGWFLLESFFELGQHFKEAYLLFIPSWFDNIPILDHTKNYFLNGTFDVLDMLSFFAGTVAAFCVLWITSKRRME
ncbi:MAG: hypothetical protein NTW12_08190 [Deltaproteobacteria bacterium]|nr:hypothetical protein [Deltaproteobacteria bacterium]